MDHLETLEPQALHRLDPDRAPRPGVGLTRGRIGDEPVVRKTARGGQRAALRREAEVLRAIGGRGVVRVIELCDGSESTELVLEDTGGPSLAAALDDPSTDATSALRLLADACDAVSRLHEMGWAHGNLTADHVLLTRRNNVRLCSLGGATTLDVDPSAGRADRVALLRIVDAWTRTRTSRTGHLPLPTRIRALVLARRTHRLPDDPDPRLLARILRRTARGGTVPWRTMARRLSTRGHRPTRTLPSIRRTGVVPAMGVVVVMGLVWMTLTSTGSERRSVVEGDGSARSSDSAAPAPSTVAADPSTSTRNSTPTSTPMTDPPEGATSGCATVDPSRPDVDGDRCGDEVRTDGNRVQVAGRTYRIGRDGDRVAVGDWDCDGAATVALLRPDTGEVHVFDGWASTGGPLDAVAWGRVDGGVSISTPADGCGPPEITTLSGSVRTAGRSVTGAGTGARR